MRHALCALLILLNATTVFASKQVRPQSPTFAASIATPDAACRQGINRAQAVTNAGDGATYNWTASNAAIVSGQGTPSITYAPADGGVVVLFLTIEWGMTFTTHRTVPVSDAPTILRQPKSTAVAPGGVATLSIAATDDAFFYDWFEGAVGDTSKLVIAGTTEFKTPPLTKSASYWVRVSNACGAVFSQAAQVTVAGKRRAAR